MARRAKAPKGMRWTHVAINECECARALILERERWNGWVIPYFTKDAGLRVAEVVTDMTRDADPSWRVEYDEAYDRFVCWEFDAEGASQRETFDAEVIDGVTYYSVGGCSWCWEEVDFNNYCRDCGVYNYKSTTTRRRKRILCDDCRRHERMAARSRC